MKHPKTHRINRRDKRLLISLTNACPYRCVFCVYLHDRQPADLPGATWLDILKKAKRHGFGFVDTHGHARGYLLPPGT
jgi:MoaA/NifB/PqqE/SkfB family radical SAM enzyme